METVDPRPGFSMSIIGSTVVSVLAEPTKRLWNASRTIILRRQKTYPDRLTSADDQGASFGLGGQYDRRAASDGRPEVGALGETLY
jgi:hypothetical protein